MIEIERTYLIKHIPKDLFKCQFKDILDVYLPVENKHPNLRLRKNGTSFEMTKKTPITGGDSSQQHEQTIRLTENEFNSLNQVAGKRVHKVRYYFKYKNQTAEIDVFQDLLKGLVLVDFEFKTTAEKDNFDIPDFCLVDITQEEFIAGGMLSGKTYKDIENDLKKFSYQKILDTSSTVS